MKNVKMTVEELEQALKTSKKTKHEIFLEENKDTILEMIRKGYSDSEIVKAINIYLSKLNRMRREAKKKGDDIEIDAPAIIPKKVLLKFLKQLRKENNTSNESNTETKAEVDNEVNNKNKKETTVKEEKKQEQEQGQGDILMNRKTVDFNDV